MDNFWTVVAALFGGFASGPLGLFAAGLCIGSIIIAVTMILGRGADRNLNHHRPMPKSKEDER